MEQGADIITHREPGLSRKPHIWKVFIHQAVKCCQAAKVFSVELLPLFKHGLHGEPVEVNLPRVGLVFGERCQAVNEHLSC